MKFKNPMLVVSDMEKSKKFYKDVLGLRVILDFGANITLTGGLCLQTRESYEEFIEVSNEDVYKRQLIMFNVEPGNFKNFFDAFYWATTALTTVGYGDIYPVTEAGKIVSMLSSCLGIAIIALPSGILTAGFMSEIERRKDEVE